MNEKPATQFPTTYVTTGAKPVATLNEASEAAEALKNVEEAVKGVEKKIEKSVEVVRAYVRSRFGNFRHPYTNTVIGKDPKKVDIDGWVQVQMDAGKLEIAPD